MTEILRHDNRNKVWYTEEEVVDKKRHSSRCGDTDEDVMQILIREGVLNGTRDDRRDRFSFQDDFEETTRTVDIERAWREKTKAIQPEGVTQNSFVRWRRRKHSALDLVLAGRSELAAGELTCCVCIVTVVTSLRPVRRKENLVDW